MRLATKEMLQKRVSHRKRKGLSTRMLHGPARMANFRQIAIVIFVYLHHHRPSFHRKVSVFIEGEREEISQKEFTQNARKTWYLSPFRNSKVNLTNLKVLRAVNEINEREKRGAEKREEGEGERKRSKRVQLYEPLVNLSAVREAKMV